VLARADVSVAMGQGADLARMQGDLVLLGNRLAAVVEARALARRMVSVIRQNLAWAAGYNAVSIPLALVGWLPPWVA
ncbi:heavy metal translocating P-type ATPase, partial [Escherichia coli]|nr:heavy metal translocating P-type ATPase [Escherichia coli]